MPERGDRRDAMRPVMGFFMDETQGVQRRLTDRCTEPSKGGGTEDEEADPRAINAQPWEPPPGMVKRQCPECRYFFAAPAIKPEAVLLCPDCAAEGTRTAVEATKGGGA